MGRLNLRHIAGATILGVSLGLTGCGKEVKDVQASVDNTLCALPNNTVGATSIDALISSCNPILKGWLEQNMQIKGMKKGGDVEKAFEIIQYYNAIFTEFTKLSPEGQKAIKEQNDWETYIVKGNNDHSSRILELTKYFQQVFTEFAKLSPEGQKAIKEQNDWEIYIVKGNYDHSSRILELTKYFQQVFTEFAKLSPEGQKAIKEQNDWKIYIIRGDSDSGSSVLTLLVDAQNKEQLMTQLTPELRSKIQSGSDLSSIDSDSRITSRASLDVSKLKVNGMSISGLSILNFPTVSTSIPQEQSAVEIVKYPESIDMSTQTMIAGKYREPSTYSVKSGELNIYFPTDGSALDKEDQDDLVNYLRALMNIKGGFPKDITVSGYADIRGSDEHNIVLSDKRVASIKRFIEEFARSNGISVKIQEASYGKGQATIQSGGIDTEKTLAKDRRVDISPSATMYMTKAIESYPADTYLIDLSGSMGGQVGSSRKRKIEVVQSAKFREGAKIIGFSSGSNVSETTLVPLSLHPSPLIAGTPLYGALIYTIMNSEQGQTITLVSDGQGEDTHLQGEIISLAKSLGVRINILGIGIPDYLQSYFRQLAKATGGGYYVSNQ